jgi:hypothetical protein
MPGGCVPAGRGGHDPQEDQRGDESNDGSATPMPHDHREHILERQEEVGRHRSAGDR